MITENDAARVFDTVLSIPGMNEPVRMDLKISRKNVLLLSHLIQDGLKIREGSSVLLGSINEKGREELEGISQECLQKAGLIELHEKLAGISASIKG
ncbi:hypothetical protein [Flavobacterium johnsoniae]|uniref:Uncharacterized protein n=1 Tax=Flavobacterium johnsoniae (strain ATCC 17061 / DSM 2064 / JCM 8514 / BCRC 14874 / CCUG 350202 / NBRC 14942 / NCIMB 11054 / UW101) TaxID=376686 RepID=A5FBN3_FLAJ1|nr:hypothetical protein [Flavobacterium johnsoniae]ABQ07385.1 hypothetical protein Fjoh_4378 [Flavobacterium johnsoniae UW101]OXE99298.1 hypothetical protein B0A63_11945 [Flavobacterium johnsoniae UW101]WQG80779.1 hypothetical protein SR927_22530 [Flavobacterium johnsoniae UW101]SHL14540.1 hypothetical protein SAMN05444146_3121 [Flavobacterium johnsoniae]